MMRSWVLVLLACASGALAQGFSVVPKAARTVDLVYQVGEADVYYAEMVVDQSVDGSFFVACGWDTGFFGLQQYDGDDKRALIFAIWNGDDDSIADTARDMGPVQILDASPRGTTNRHGKNGLGAQFMRQIPWKVGETNRFVVDASLKGQYMTYSAWFFDQASEKWEKLATFRGFSAGKWLRGIHSSIQDIRRDTKSAAQARRARFGNMWIHQYGGTYISAADAMFVGSRSPLEARETIDSGVTNGFFSLATGGGTLKTTKIGETLRIPSESSKQWAMPSLKFLNLNKEAP